VSWIVPPAVDTRMPSTAPAEAPDPQLPPKDDARDDGHRPPTVLPNEVKDAARDHYRRATASYDLGRYAQAAKEYELTYENSLDPSMLFNAAQAYRLLKDWPKSVFLYSSYVRLAPAGPMADSARSRIAELKQLIDYEDPFADEGYSPGQSAKAARLSLAAAHPTVTRPAAVPAAGAGPEPQVSKTVRYAVFAGLGGFVLIFALALFRLREATPVWADTTIFALSIAATLYVAYLTYIELFVLGAVCPWCVAVALCSVTVLVVVSLELLRPRRT